MIAFGLSLIAHHDKLSQSHVSISMKVAKKIYFFLDKNAAIIKNIYYLLLNSVSKLDTRMKHRHICQFLSFYEIQVLGTISRKNLQFFCL